MGNPRVAIVTGAASGMGRAAAVRLARAGTKVAAVDWAASSLKDLEAVGEAGTAREAIFEARSTTPETVSEYASSRNASVAPTDKILQAR